MNVKDVKDGQIIDVVFVKRDPLCAGPSVPVQSTNKEDFMEHKMHEKTETGKMAEEWKYTQPDQDNVCFTDFKVYSDVKCETASDTLLKGLADVKVKKCADDADKVMLFACGETKLSIVEGANYGATCADAGDASADATKLTDITVKAVDGKVACALATLKDGTNAYISYTGSGWKKAEAGEGSSNTSNTTGG